MRPPETDLFALPALSADEREGAAGVARRLEPFLAAGGLESVDVAVVARLARLVGAWDPEPLVAMAAAVRAPRRGHICLDLEAPEPWPHFPEGAQDPPEWPEAPAMRDRLRASPLVASPESLHGDAGRRPFVFDGRRLYTARYWDDQLQLAERLRALADAPPAEPVDLPRLQRGLAALFSPPPVSEAAPVDRQAVAAALAVLGRFTVITGGPGMGKTHTVRNLLALLFSQHEARRTQDPGRAPLQVALAAPTGKAAARMRESLVDEMAGFMERAGPAVDAPDALAAFLENLEAQTVHRLLGVRSDDPSRFRHDARRPLQLDAVVVDETSMVDFALMARLVEALGPETRLVLLGDRHQLASVEAGTVLADICGASSPAAPPALSATLRERLGSVGLQVPAPVSPPVSPLADSVIQLNRTYRFSGESSIGRFARDCLAENFDAVQATAALFGPAGSGPAPPGATTLDPGDGRVLPVAVRASILQGYAPTYDHLASPLPAAPEDEPAFHRRALELFDRFRVLCAHRRGQLGVEGINRAVEVALGRERGLATGDRFWEGRPILIRRNDYEVKLYNGDIGLVVKHRNRRGQVRTVVAFPGPATLPVDAPPDAPSWREPKLIRYVPISRLPEHDTCFALTIHKSQGSEFPHAMVVLPPGESPILTRELVYTAVTRAREQVTLVGTRTGVQRALARVVQRGSGLGDRLWRGPEGGQEPD